MRKLITIILLLAAALFSLALAAASPAPVTFSHVLPDNVEGLGYINAIAQDRQGFMWFGGANGLARYDGYQLKYYRQQDNGLGSNFINDIILSREGTLWVATRHGLSRYLPDLDTFKTFHHPNGGIAGARANDINSIHEDAHKRLWLGTRGGLYQFDAQQRSFSHYNLYSFGQNASRDVSVWSIAEDAFGELWIGTLDHGVVRFDPALNNLQHYSLAARNNDGAVTDVRQVYVDSDNTVWVGTFGGGLYRYSREDDSVNYVQHDVTNAEKRLTVWSILKDRQGSFWIGDGDALHAIDSKNKTIDPENKKTRRYTYSDTNPSGLGNYAPTVLFQDRSNNIWVGYFPSGIDIINRDAAVFQNYTHSANDLNSVAKGGVLDAVEDASNNLWVGTGYGLDYFDRANNSFTHFSHDPKSTHSLSGNTVLSILYDRAKTLWVGVFSGGVNRSLDNGKTFVHYAPNPSDANALVGNEAWDIIEDSRGVIWIATEKGLNRYNPEQNNFTYFTPPESLAEGSEGLYTRVIYEDKNSNLWLGTVFGLYLFDRETGEFFRYSTGVDSENSPSANFIITIFEDSRGELWVGSHGGGAATFDRDRHVFTRYTTREGLPNDVVTSIAEDNLGRLWLSTHKGLARFNPNDNVFDNFDKRDGLPTSFFNRNAALALHSKELFFGSSKGFTIFDPLSIKENNLAPPVVLTDFFVFNKPVNVSENKFLKKSVTEADSIILSYSDSVVTFEFAALNYVVPEKNQYAYFLDGFDSEWNHVGVKRTATYTNLDPGTYVFRVRASNNDGVWSETSRDLQLVVTPPLWRTWWAIIAYIILFGLFVLLVMALELKRQSLRREILVGRRLREMSQLKDEFMANTSHELRTPLNGMIGLAESLKYELGNSLSKSAKNRLDIIVSSGRRLSCLVNDILDYSKLADDRLELNKECVDLYTMTEVVFSLLEPLVRSKPLKLVNALSPVMPRVLADEKRLQQILINLVGNAIKFSQHGYITVSASCSKGRIIISVEDNGVGIPLDQVEKIFEPFHQLANMERDVGTGLGLSVTKKLVEAHGGKISLTSMPTIGSEFIFDLEQCMEAEACLPRSKTSNKRGINHSEKIAEAQLRNMDTDLTGQEKPMPFFNPPENSNEFIILIVDDDPVNRMVLQGILALHYYQVVEAECAEEALAIIEERGNIDLVILDVMMPGMSGYDACRKIREKYSIERLPIVFLSAKTSDKDLVTGYKVGGNEFLLKPVSKIELLPKVATYMRVMRAHKKSEQ